MSVPLRALLGWLVLTSCAAPAPGRVPSSSLSFAGGHATWREWPSEAALCEAEPRFLLDELSSVNEVLRRFLVKARGDTWNDERISLVEDAARELRPMMDRHRATLAAVARCPFAGSSAFPAVTERGRALLADTDALLDGAPAAIASARAERAKREWLARRGERQEQARQACPARLGKVVVYFAWVDEGVTTWLFCDGANVVAEGGREPSFSPAADSPRRRHPRAKAYLEAARRFPPQAIEQSVGPGAAVSAW
jgi:hypothetical protein